MNFLRKNIGEIILGIFLCGVFGGLMQIDLLAGTADSFDFNVFHYQEQSPNPEIIIVALDDKTINNPDFKRYQDIDRGDYAQVLENIFLGDPLVSAVDVFFYNESEDTEEDARLANLFQENANLITANEWLSSEYRLLQPNEALNIPPSQLGYVNVYSNSANEKNLINKVEVHFDPEAPYSTENESLMIKVYRALSYGRQMAYFDREKNTYTITRNTEETIIPIQDQGININFYGEPHSFQTISFYDVWNGDIDPEIFANKIVLIGETAADAHDAFFVPTSNGEFMPGVEIHANFLQTIMEQDFLTYQTNTQKILMVFVIFIVLTIIFAFGNLLIHALASLLIGIGFYVFAIWSYRNGFLISYIWPIIFIAMYWTGVHTLRFIQSEKSKREMRAAFSKYVAKDVVDQILKNPEKINLGGQTHEVTIFFSDLVNFTHLSESLTPHEVTTMINIYLSEMSRIILNEGGTIDKYIGDAIMAYWGAPLPCKEHAFRTCRVALLQRKALDKVNHKLKEHKLPSVDMRIGIASGNVVAGNIGTNDRMEYTVMGDHVNLASRLEGINKQYNTHITIGEGTQHLIKDKFFTRELDSIRVKGKNEPIRIHELICEKNEATQTQKDIVKNYGFGLLAYRKRNWAEAMRHFKANPQDKPSQIMLERIEELKQINLPKNWDGVHTFSSK